MKKPLLNALQTIFTYGKRLEDCREAVVKAAIDQKAAILVSPREYNLFFKVRDRDLLRKKGVVVLDITVPKLMLGWNKPFLFTAEAVQYIIWLKDNEPCKSWVK